MTALEKIFLGKVSNLRKSVFESLVHTQHHALVMTMGAPNRFWHDAIDQFEFFEALGGQGQLLCGIGRLLSGLP